MRINCNLCFSRFTGKSEFLNHLKIDHKQKEQYNLLSCPAKNCDREYTVFKSLSRHIDSCDHLKICKSDDDTLDTVCENLANNLCVGEPIENEKKNGDFFCKDLNPNKPLVEDASIDFFLNEAIPNACYSGTKKNFEYDYRSGAPSMQEFIKNVFAKGIDELSLTTSAMDQIYKLTERFVKELRSLYSSSLQIHSQAPVEEVLNVTTDFVLSKLKTLDTDYKKNKFIESQPNHVKVEDVCIAVNWKMHSEDNKPVFDQVRSTYSYVSIIDTKAM